LLCIALPVDSAQRTFVSGQGNDGNACSLTAPCRSFATAIDHTDINGEIVVLDSAGYGPVAIDKSVAIIAPPGIYGGITAMAGNGIDIDGAGFAITLRGLTINGQGGGQGISIVRSARVYIDRCVVSNFTSDGIRIGFPATFGGVIRVTDSTVRGNGGDGINLVNGRMTVEDSHIVDNVGVGLNASNGSVSVQRSSLSGNGDTGFRTTSPVTIVATVNESVIAGNGVRGLAALAGVSGTVHLVAHSNVVSDTGPACAPCNGIAAQGAAGASVVLAAARNVVARSGGYGLRDLSFATFYTYVDNILVDNGVGTKLGTFVTALYE
jgi:hypothetical protein